VFLAQAQGNPSAGRPPAVAIVRPEPPPNPRALGVIRQIESYVRLSPRHATVPTENPARPYQGLTPNRECRACPKRQSCMKSRLRAPLGETPIGPDSSQVSREGVMALGGGMRGSNTNIIFRDSLAYLGRITGTFRTGGPDRVDLRSYVNLSLRRALVCVYLA
jgi:hypothetical protein